MTADDLSTGDVRILVVEDQAIVARDLEQTLADLGHEVVGTASTAAGAVEQAREQGPDLVLMDIRMPGEADGVDAARIIGDELGLPVVFLTAYADRDLLRRVTRSDPYGYVVKPYDARGLEAAIQFGLRRKREERAREERERWFERILEHVRDIVGVVDPSGTVEYVSPAVEEVLGFAPGDRVGRDALELVHPDDEAAFRRALRGALREPGQSMEAEARFRKAGGDWRLLDVVGRTYASESREGGFRLVVDARDVTDRRAVEERLEASQERYRVLFEKGVAGAFQATTDGELLDGNAALAEMLGYGSVEELLAASMDRAFHGDDWDDVVRLVGEEGVAVNRDVRALRRDAGPAHLLLSCALSRVPGRQEPVIIGTAVDITDRKRLADRLEWMAYHDPLTGLLNRRSLADQASRYLSLAERRESRLAVAYLDLEGFKTINDELGHDAGDVVLSQVGERLNGQARESDVVARVGGDEFVVLMPDVGDADGAVAAARRFADALDEPVELEEERVSVRGQFGIAVYPDHGSTFEELLASADATMYRLKESGAGGVAVSRSDAPATGSEPGRDEALGRALEAGELTVRYQPIVRAKDARLMGLEVLLRWRRPDGTLSDAGEFLPRAQRSGMMSRVDDHMLGLVTRDLSSTSLPEDLRWVSLNLEPSSLADDAIADRLSTLAVELRGRGVRTTVELTGRPHEGGLASAGPELSHLRRQEISIALDDFGGGSTSLALLTSLPAEFVKVSRAGVAAMSRPADDGEALSALIRLMHALDVSVVVEEVDELRDRDRARVGGADFLQGYAVGRPGTLSGVSEDLHATGS